MKLFVTMKTKQVMMQVEYEICKPNWLKKVLTSSVSKLEKWERKGMNFDWRCHKSFSIKQISKQDHHSIDMQPKEAYRDSKMGPVDLQIKQLKEETWCLHINA